MFIREEIYKLAAVEALVERLMFSYFNNGFYNELKSSRTVVV